MNIHCIPLLSNPLLHSPSIRLISSPTFHKCPQTSAPILLRVSASTIPARDRVVEFGKHKGKMLGTLPSNYLKWVSKNLRTRDFEDWAKLADQVLEDPVYRDRIEWEFADRLLSGNDVSTRSDGSAVSELLELSERFGWDNEDKAGWSRIDFGLLGTSKGGRIPRVSEIKGVERELRVKKREKVRDSNKGIAIEGRERRKERRERVRSKSVGGSTTVLVSQQPLKKLGSEEMSSRTEEIEEDRTAEIRSPFPGRQSLLEKALSRRRP